jgi:hypothetical protein
MRFALCFVLTMLASHAFTQTVNQSAPHSSQMLWEPPEWNFPENVKASVPKEMFSSFRVSGYDITLEDTSMENVKKRLGGEIGRKGDAGDALEWLCFHGADANSGWVLWLESGEIDGGNVGSFQWHRLSNRDVLDSRCHALTGTTSSIKLPLPLMLGAKKAEVLKILGEPTATEAERLIYLHEHEGTSRGVPFTTSNIVVVHLRDGIVWAIQASKTSSS